MIKDNANNKQNITDIPNIIKDILTNSGVLIN